MLSEPLTRDEACTLSEWIYGRPQTSGDVGKVADFLDVNRLIAFIETGSLIKQKGSAKVAWATEWRELLKMRLRGWSGPLVAELYGISRARVYQVEQRVLRGLRHPSKRVIWERRES